MNRRWPVIFLLLLLLPAIARAAETIPPRPEKYFNDYAGVIDPAVAEALNTQLADFERDTTNQVVVAVFPKMDSDAAMADYCARIFNNWGIGQKDKNNGVAVFVFIADRKLQITTGRGMEKLLPDAACKTIIDDKIVPHFKKTQYADGLAAGITAILDATRPPSATTAPAATAPAPAPAKPAAAGGEGGTR